MPHRTMLALGTRLDIPADRTHLRERSAVEPDVGYCRDRGDKRGARYA
jgi:hypothetical protein